MNEGIDFNSSDQAANLPDKLFHIDYGRLAISYHIGGSFITKDMHVSLYSHEICQQMNPGEDATKLICVNIEDVCQDCDVCVVRF